MKPGCGVLHPVNNGRKAAAFGVQSPMMSSINKIGGTP